LFWERFAELNSKDFEVLSGQDHWEKTETQLKLKEQMKLEVKDERVLGFQVKGTVKDVTEYFRNRYFDLVAFLP
jgi:hypothetical protein